MLILEGFQAGLSWLTILKKRQNFRAAFFNFNPKKMATLKEADIKKLLKNPGIVRNRLKIEAARANASAFLITKEEFGSFKNYIWQFTEFKTIHSSRKAGARAVTRTKESDLMSKDLKKRGFKFVGSTICYAFMQAVGMVEDHDPGCFLKKQKA
jgi:DNA-3-methyladenine glycosylase I